MWAGTFGLGPKVHNESGIIHGDLAAHGGNIIIEKKEGIENPLLIDFELSRSYPEMVWKTEEELRDFEEFAKDNCPVELPLYLRNREQLMKDFLRNQWCYAQREDGMGVARSTGTQLLSRCQGVENLDDEILRILKTLK